MSTETDIRRRWKDTQWWGFEERREDGDDGIAVKGPAGEIFSYWSDDVTTEERDFFRRAAAAPEDIHRLLAVIDGLRSEVAELRAGTPPDKLSRGNFFLTLTEEDITRIELLYDKGRLTAGQEHAAKQGIPPTDYADIDEAMDEFVAEAIDLAWDMAQGELDSFGPSGPMVKSA